MYPYKISKVFFDNLWTKKNQVRSIYILTRGYFNVIDVKEAKVNVGGKWLKVTLEKAYGLILITVSSIKE